MNRLEKENLKKAVPFEELRDIRLAAINLQSTDADTACKAALSLASVASISNCDIMIEQDAVFAVVAFLENCTSDRHLCSACDLLLAMFRHELELVQENVLKASGIILLYNTLSRFPDSITKIIETIRMCVFFFNAGQNNARETGVLTGIIDLDRTSPGLYGTQSCMHAMCYLNFVNSSIAETSGFDTQYKINAHKIDFDKPHNVKEEQRDFDQVKAAAAASRPFSSRSTFSTVSQLQNESLPFEVGAQIRAIKALKESFAADKSGIITTAGNSSTELLKKSLERSHVGPDHICNPLLNHESATLNDVATRILGPRQFMDVIRRADAILSKDIPETKTSECFGPQNHSFKTHGRISEEAWSCVRYVKQIPAGSLGTIYGQHPVSFLKWFYAGQTMEDKAHGNGVFRWVNGSKYAGQILNSKRHGLGKMTFDTSDSTMASDLCTSSGTTYHGEWQNDKIHGIGMFKFHRDDGGGSLCGIFDEGKLTPHSFTEEILPEDFIASVHIEERKADALSAEAIQNASSTIFRHNYDANDGHFLFPLHYTPQRALIQRPGARGEETTNIKTSRF